MYQVRVTANVGGVSSVGGVSASREDSRTEVLVQMHMLPLCVVCASAKIHTQKCLNTAQANPLLKVLRVVLVLDGHII